MTRTMHASSFLRAAPLRALIAITALSLAACGGDRAGEPVTGATVAQPPLAPSAGAPLQVPGSSQQVETRIGDTTVYAVAMPTAAIPAPVAAEHGIERRPDLVMLRVSGRRGEPGNLVSVPLKVQAAVTDLRAQQQTLEMKEVLAAGLVDYVGTYQAELPDTLRFDIVVTTPEGATQTLQLTRELQTAIAPGG